MQLLALAGVVCGLLSPPAAGVSVTTSVSSTAEIVPGTTVSYSVQVTAPFGANEVEVGGALPQGLAFAGGEQCLPEDAAVLCSLGDLAPGETAAASFQVDTAPSLDPGRLDMTMWTSCQGCDVTSPATATATIRPQADLTLDEDGPSVLRAGRQSVYTLTVQNEGPSDSRDVVVADQLPSPLTFVSGEGCEGEARQVRCTVEVVRPGGQHRFHVVVAAPGELGADRDVANTASVGSDTADPDPSGDTATVRSALEDRARLTVGVTTDSAVIVPGKAFAYTIEVHNDGPSQARDVVVKDVLPEGLELADPGQSSPPASGIVESSPPVYGSAPPADPDLRTPPTTTPTAHPPSPSATPSATAGSAGTVSPRAGSEGTASVVPTPRDGATGGFAGTASVGAAPRGQATAGSKGTASARAFMGGAGSQATAGDGHGDTWRLGAIPAGEARSVTIRAWADPDTPAGIIADTATATCADCETTAKATTRTIVRPSADVMVTAEVRPGRLGPGEQAKFILTLTNKGPSTATGMTVTDELPEALSAAPVPGCSLRLRLLTCEVPRLAPGQSRTWTVDVRAPAQVDHPLTLLDKLNVTLPGTITDPDPASQSASVAAELVMPETRWPLMVAGAALAAALGVSAVLFVRRRHRSEAAKAEVRG